jgi:hypothetical protein
LGDRALLVTELDLDFARIFRLSTRIGRALLLSDSPYR